MMGFRWWWCPRRIPAVTIHDLLQSRTIRMVAYANHGMCAAMRAMQQALIRIRDDGSTRNVEQDIAPLSDVFQLQSDFQRDREETGAEPAPALSWDMACVPSGTSRGPRF